MNSSGGASIAGLWAGLYAGTNSGFQTGFWRTAGLVAVVAAALSAVGTGAARADVFTVEGIRVDATAGNATEARGIAHAQGRRTAFDQVMKRITRQQDWALLPQPDAVALSDLTASLKIEDERNSADRYVASITYRFRPSAVREALRSAGVAFSETQAKPAIVLPVYEDQNGPTLWRGANPWMAAWADRALDHELTPMAAPIGDLADIASVTVETALTGNWFDFERLASRYDGAEVIVAHAVRVVPNNPFAQPGIPDLSDNTNPSTATATGEVVAGAQTLQPDGASQPEIARLEVKAERITRDGREAFTIVVDGPVDPGAGPTVFQKAVDATVTVFSSDWKSRTLVDYGATYRMEATVRLASLQDWTDFQRRLGEIPLISGLRTVALSAQGAELDILFAGSVDQLALSLDQNGLMLSGENGIWEILRRGIVPTALEDGYGNRPDVFEVDDTYEDNSRSRGRGAQRNRVTPSFAYKYDGQGGSASGRVVRVAGGTPAAAGTGRAYPASSTRAGSGQTVRAPAGYTPGYTPGPQPVSSPPVASPSTYAPNTQARAVAQPAAAAPVNAETVGRNAPTRSGSIYVEERVAETGPATGVGHGYEADDLAPSSMTGPTTPQSQETLTTGRDGIGGAAGTSNRPSAWERYQNLRDGDGYYEFDDDE